jgi:hypothetical protein
MLRPLSRSWVLATALSSLIACSDDQAPAGPPSMPSTDSGVADGPGSDSTEGSTPTIDATPGHCPNTTVVCNGHCLLVGESSGNCTVIVAGIGGTAMALTSTHFYYADYDFTSPDLDAFVYRLPLGGGTPQKFSGAMSVIADIRTDQNYLYFMTELGLFLGSPDFYEGTIGRIPLAGGDAQILTTKAGDKPAAMALTPSHVYWVGESPGAKFDPPSFGPAVHRLALTGGDVADIGVSTKPQTVAVDATHVYWADDGAIWRTPTATAGTISIVDAGLDAGGATKVADTQTKSIQIALDGDVIYYANGDSGGLYRVAKEGGTPMLVADGKYVLNLVVDTDDVFFTGEFGDVRRYHKADGTSATIAEVASWGTRAIAVSGDYVYELVVSISAGQGAGGIVRIAK